MKGILSFLLALILAFSMIPNVFAENETLTDGDYTYTVENGEAAITGYTGAGGDITIPSALGGCPVTSIGEGAFYCCYDLTAVTIPDGINRIESQVFAWCYSLTSVIIPNSVTIIGDMAFSGCTSLPSVDIPSGVTHIGSEAFSMCTSLISVTIPNSVTYIGAEAFSECTNLSIYGTDGSCAQQYAEANSIPFVALKNYEASNGEERFATLQAALDAYEGGTIQLLADAGSVAVPNNAVVDLNGFSIASVTATAAELTVLDSKTDDYSVEDDNYGKIATITGSVTPAAGYIAIVEADGTSCHKVSLEITDMTLRSANAGVYYKCAFNGDEMVAAQVTSYGVALSLRSTPEIGAAGSEYSVFTEFTTGVNTPSTLLKNVMKETNTVSQNNRNANMKVYGRPYIQIGERYIYGETVFRSFRKQVELVDTSWSTLTTEQQTAVLTMYRTFQEDMTTWTIPNIKASIL